MNSLILSARYRYNWGKCENYPRKATENVKLKPINHLEYEEFIVDNMHITYVWNELVDFQGNERVPNESGYVNRTG